MSLPLFKNKMSKDRQNPLRRLRKEAMKTPHHLCGATNAKPKKNGRNMIQSSILMAPELIHQKWVSGYPWKDLK